MDARGPRPRLLSLLGVVDRLAVHGGLAEPASLGSKLQTSERQHNLQRDVRRWLWDSRWRPGERGCADNVSRVPRWAVASGEWRVAVGIATRGGRYLRYRPGVDSN
jgi:hypothetical protein